MGFSEGASHEAAIPYGSQREEERARGLAYGVITH